MTDSNDTPIAPSGGGAPMVAQTDGTPPAEAAPEAVGLESMTPEQIDALAARIEQTRANRPASLTQQLAELQAALTDTASAKDEKVQERKSARDEADKLEAKLSEIQQTLRKTEIVEAATAAQFKNPQAVAEFLAGREGDVAQLVTEAAASGVFAMVTPSQSADVGGQGSKSPGGMDAGRAALIAEIAAAQGR